MVRIDTNGWDEFVISDLFDIRPTKAYKLINDQLFEDSGTNPVVVNSGFNNGIGGYTNRECTENAGIITFTDTAAKSAVSFFYQERNFVGYPHVQGMYPKNHKLTKYESLFLTTVIRASVGKYDFISKMTRDDILNLVIKLPSTPDGSPDWEYMGTYMQKVFEGTGAILGNLTEADARLVRVDTHAWQKFIIGDLFERLQLDIRKDSFNKTLDVSVEKTDEFNLPLVNAKHGNNGIMYYGRETDFDTAEMSIDIVQNGAIATGDVYAQPQKTGVLWDAYLVKPKAGITSPLVLLFLATVLKKAIKDKFSYDDKCIWDKAKLLPVMLPCTVNGEPDWMYMDTYMSEVMQKAESSLDALRQVHT